MLISDSHKFVFLHVPKTGGDSIEKSLQIYASKICCWNYQTNTNDLPELKHITVQNFKKMYQQKYKNYFVFAFIRKPSKLIKSWWQFHQSNPWVKEFVPDNYKLAIKTPLLPWIKVAEVATDQQILDFVIKSNGCLGVDYLGTTETIDEDIKFIENKLGLKIPLEKVNVSTQQKIDDKILDQIDKLYPNSYALWSYVTKQAKNRQNLRGKSVKNLF